MTYEKKLKRILSCHSRLQQINKAIEELNECATALEKSDRDKIVEEIADVEVMIDQIKIMYNCADEVLKIKELKTDRTVKIIDGKCKVKKINRPSFCGKVSWACNVCKNDK